MGPGAFRLQFPRPSLLFMCICIWYLSVFIFHCVVVYLVESLWCCLITISPPFSCILVYLHLVSQCLYFSLCFCVFGGIILVLFDSNFIALLVYFSVFAFGISVFVFFIMSLCIWWNHPGAV